MKEMLARLRYWLKPGKNCHGCCLWCEHWDTHCRDYRQMEQEEHRCRLCSKWESCPAYETGVL